jgi:phosphatidylinositol alpha-1,6-mannosyltransferase
MKNTNSKILLVTMEFPPFKGGVGNYYFDLAKNLTDYQTDVLLDGENAEFKLDDLSVSRTSFFYQKFWPKWLKLFIRLFKIALTKKYQLLWVGHLLPVGTVAFLINKIFNLPYIVSLHGLDIKRALKNKNFLTKLILKNASLVTANSVFTLNEFKKSGVNTEFVIIYPCAHILNGHCSLPTNDQKNDLKQRLNLQDKKILLTVARLTERKGHDLVIRALPEILKTNKDVVYLIVGQGDKERLQKMVVENNLENQVLFLNNVSDEDLPIYYSIADIFVLPTRIINEDDVEGFGIVYLEANSFCVPVIASNTGGASEAVIDGLNGLIVDPTNSTELAEKIVVLLNDKELAEKLGKVGKERVENNFQIKDQVNKLNEEINKILVI